MSPAGHTSESLEAVGAEIVVMFEGTSELVDRCMGRHVCRFFQCTTLVWCLLLAALQATTPAHVKKGAC